MTESVGGSTFEVVRTVNIAAPPDAIFGHLDDFHRWTAWSPWEAIDPTMWRGYEGAPSGTGAVYEWKGKVGPDFEKGLAQLKVVAES